MQALSTWRSNLIITNTRKPFDKATSGQFGDICTTSIPQITIVLLRSLCSNQSPSIIPTSFCQAAQSRSAEARLASQCAIDIANGARWVGHGWAALWLVYLLEPIYLAEIQISAFGWATGLRSGGQQDFISIRSMGISGS